MRQYGMGLHKHSTCLECDKVLASGDAGKCDFCKHMFHPDTLISIGREDNILFACSICNDLLSQVEGV